jgi:uncharacterized protein (TIGR02145 family)
LGGDTVAGGKLKSTSYWAAPNTGATNETGFNGFPSGWRSGSIGLFSNAGESADYWSSTVFSSTASWLRELSTYDTQLFRNMSFKRDGFSVRCLLDGVDPANPGTVTGNDGKVYPTVKIGTQV